MLLIGIANCSREMRPIAFHGIAGRFQTRHQLIVITLQNSMEEQSMRRNFLFIVLVVVCAFFAANLAMADDSSLPFNVTASVANSCTISAVTGIAFGAYDPTAASPLDQAGSISFKCVKGTSYKTFIAGTRTMTGAGGSLPFLLFSDSGHTTAFASDATGGGATAADINTINTSVYGRIAAGQDVAVGSDYAVALTATVEY
jgi:spore coat protein U-like protein